MFERKSLVQAMYELCMAYKEMGAVSEPRTADEDAALDGMNDAINELCRTVGLSRLHLEQDCY